MVDAALAERACAQLALGRLACQALGRRRQRARHERVGLRELKRLGGQQGAQSKWRMCERGDATQLTIVRLKHVLGERELEGQGWDLNTKPHAHLATYSQLESF